MAGGTRPCSEGPRPGATPGPSARRTLQAHVPRPRDHPGSRAGAAEPQAAPPPAGTTRLCAARGPEPRGRNAGPQPGFPLTVDAARHAGGRKGRVRARATPPPARRVRALVDSAIPDVQQLSWPFPPLSDLASARKRPLLSSGPEPATTFPAPHFLSRGLYADSAPPPTGCRPRPRGCCGQLGPPGWGSDPGPRPSGLWGWFSLSLTPQGWLCCQQHKSGPPGRLGRTGQEGTLPQRARTRGHRARLAPVAGWGGAQAEMSDWLTLAEGRCPLELRTDNWGHSSTFPEQMGDTSGRCYCGRSSWGGSGERAAGELPSCHMLPVSTELAILGHSGSHGLGLGVVQRPGQTQGEGPRGSEAPPTDLCPTESGLWLPSPSKHPALPGEPRAGGPSRKASKHKSPVSPGELKQNVVCPWCCVDRHPGHPHYVRCLLSVG